LPSWSWGPLTKRLAPWPAYLGREGPWIDELLQSLEGIGSRDERA
jgi:hypothetical protein